VCQKKFIHPGAALPDEVFYMDLKMSERWITDDRSLWITQGGIETRAAAPLLRRSFNVPGPVASARLFICGLGYYEAWMNGCRVGDHVLDPAQTDYEKRVFYVAHDVTSLVRDGENALGVMLGNGWYNQDRVWGGFSYGVPKLFAELHLTFTDGSTQVILTDQQWRASSGPVTDNNIYAGEVYDARLEQSGWNKPGFDDSAWGIAAKTSVPGGVFEEQAMPPIRRIETRVPVSIIGDSAGRFTVDMGQNFSGWARIKVRAPAGTEIGLRFAETIDADGPINTDSCGVIHTKVEQIDRYICKGIGEEVWEPRFTCHGFRYVEVSGWPGELPPDQIAGIVVHTDLPVTGSFECSNDRLNQLHRMALWTHRSNIHSIPEDCPVRERCGWLGDANVVSEFSMWNFQGKAFWEKYLDDIETARSLNAGLPAIRMDNWSLDLNSVCTDNGGLPTNIAPGKRTAGTANPDWAATFIMLPWYVYLYYGDDAVLTKHWTGMNALMEHYRSRAVDGCLNGGFGDWFDPGGEACCSHTAPDLTTTLWFYRCSQVMSLAASRLSDSALHGRYAGWAEWIKEGFVRRFYNRKAGTFGSQTANVMALQFEIPEEAERPRVFASLLRDIEQRQNHFNVGIMGMRYLFEVLSRNGQGDLALKLLEQNTYPSFGDLINRGATTLWEYWGEPEHDIREGARSLNHPMMGGYDNWFYNTLAGIRIDSSNPGFKHFFLEPMPVPAIQWVSAHHDSPYGRISSVWKYAGGKLEWDVVVPAGTTASARQPLSHATLHLPAGTHHFSDLSAALVADASVMIPSSR
jgi:alpha-L-rhamnosidase